MFLSIKDNSYLIKYAGPFEKKDFEIDGTISTAFKLESFNIELPNINSDTISILTFDKDHQDKDLYLANCIAIYRFMHNAFKIKLNLCQIVKLYLDISKHYPNKVNSPTLKTILDLDFKSKFHESKV